MKASWNFKKIPYQSTWVASYRVDDEKTQVFKITKIKEELFILSESKGPTIPFYFLARLPSKTECRKFLLRKVMGLPQKEYNSDYYGSKEALSGEEFKVLSNEIKTFDIQNA